MRCLPSLDDVDVAGKKVLIRADLNVPMKNGIVTDATRIKRFAPTVDNLVKRGATVVIMTHLGRPQGEANPHYSTQPIALGLSEVLGRDVTFLSDCVGPISELGVGKLAVGSVAMLENVRFHRGETGNSRNFALRLSVHGDIYVNDAFSCAHRAHASTHAIAQLMPSHAGPSLLAEVQALETALATPKRPAAALVGGAKVSSKIDVLRNLSSKVDYLIIGGGMANTFLAANGIDVGRSLHEPGVLSIAQSIMATAEKSGCKIVLPVDVVVANEFSATAPHHVSDIAQIEPLQMALDCGPVSAAMIINILRNCKTLLWNGPLGAFELEPFATATNAVARAAAALTRSGDLITVAGGGDTVAALNGAGVANDFTYISTAGGAFLEWLEGRPLPGIEILKSNHKQKEGA